MTTVGLGVYTLQEAARLIHAESRSLKRWLYGYHYRAQSSDGQAKQNHSSALWVPQYSTDALGEAVIGFQDLLELRVVREFVQRGVPLIVVRRCLETAKELFGAPYPLTKQRFMTDGQTIYHEALKAGDAEGNVLNLRTRQYAFREIIRESLYSGIEYDGDLARRWFPESRSRMVMLDPDLQFGRPILRESAVPTATIYASFLAEDKQATKVARLFEVSPREVNAAVRFESRLRHAA